MLLKHYMYYITYFKCIGSKGFMYNFKYVKCKKFSLCKWYFPNKMHNYIMYYFLPSKNIYEKGLRIRHASTTQSLRNNLHKHHLERSTEFRVLYYNKRNNNYLGNEYLKCFITLRFISGLLPIT